MQIETLFIDDDEDLRLAAKQMFDLAAIKARILSSAEQALAIISRDYPAILVSDIRMPQMDGIELLKKTILIDEELPVLLISGHADINLAVGAMRDGAYDFIEKPFEQERFLDAINRAKEKRRLTLENRQLRNSVSGGLDDLDNQIIGSSEKMREIKAQIRTIASSSADILIIGDTGVGKELCARAIHSLSNNKVGPFIAINCAALPKDMIERELFGYEASAFAGASRARFGKFEHGKNGTIFLDNIISLPKKIQAKLLRVIEENAIFRLGSNQEIPLNARFIASSCVDLENAAKKGKFRSDLLYRLNVATIKIPPLSSRREDIAELFFHFLRQAAIRFRKEPKSISNELLSLISNMDWPGNVRELRNFADRFTLGIELESDFQKREEKKNLAEKMNDFEKQIIIRELKSNSGRLKPTYQNLGISRKSLYEKMQKYSLKRDDFKTKI